MAAYYFDSSALVKRYAQETGSSVSLICEFDQSANIFYFIRTIAPPPDVLKEIWAESKRKGLNKLTMREINAEIAAYRREKRKKATVTQSAK